MRACGKGHDSVRDNFFSFLLNGRWRLVTRQCSPAWVVSGQREIQAVTAVTARRGRHDGGGHSLPARTCKPRITKTFFFA
jgi:hypothetical protein